MTIIVIINLNTNLTKTLDYIVKNFNFKLNLEFNFENS